MKAFSLIELMVVIAIIGVLAALAVPSYGEYTKKAKIATAFPQAHAVAEKAIMYYDTHSTFPTSLAQIGYPTSFENIPNSVAEYAIPPYIATIGIGVNQTPGDCSYFSVGYAISNFDNSGAYTASTSFPVIGVQQLYILNGSDSWIPLCYYYEISSTGTQDTGSSVLSNCYNSGNAAELAEFMSEFNALLASCP